VARAGLGCGVMALIAGGLTLWISQTIKNDTEKEIAHPTCASDFHHCADNADIINHYHPKNGISMSVECESVAEETAKFGKPSFSWPGFWFVLRGSLIRRERDGDIDRQRSAIQQRLWSNGARCCEVLL
jgi:hypothetical protein